MLPMPKVSLKNFTASYFLDWWNYIVSLVKAITGSFAPAIVWNPDGGGTATTFAQVMAQVSASSGGQRIQLVGGTAAPYTVPTPGVYDLKYCWFALPGVAGPGTVFIDLADGVVLHDMGAPAYGAAVRGHSTSLPCLTYTPQAPGQPEFLQIGFEGGLSNQSPNSTPMWRPVTSIAVLISENGVLNPSSTAPIFEVAVGNAVIVGVDGGFAAPAGFAVGLGTLIWDNDGSAPSPFPATPGLSVQVQGSIGQSCANTATRPVGIFEPLPIGMTVWQIDIEANITWDGTAWQEQLGSTLLAGDGSGGEVTISAPTTITEDLYAQDLIVNDVLIAQGVRIFVKGRVSGTGVISWAGTDAFTDGVGGVNGAARSAGTGDNGSNGSTGDGTDGNAFASPSFSGNSGAGGDGTGHPGGAGASVVPPDSTAGGGRDSMTTLNGLVILDSSLVQLTGGAGGASGGGDGVNIGGGGGAGGCNGILSCKVLDQSAGLTLTTAGGRGGDGQVNAGSNAAGGGGGGGGNLYATFLVRIPGGPLDTSGGLGGAGQGTGTAGSPGTPGRLVTTSP